MALAKRIAGSLAIVLIAHWLYMLLAVPWIEPPAELHSSEAFADGAGIGGSKIIEAQLKQLKGLFPPDAWELKDPVILEILAGDRAKLLLQKYHTRDDGRVEIHPCTIVFAYDGDAEDEDQRWRQAIILEVPGGGVFQFDKPLDLNQKGMGRLVKGELNGRVTIRSDWKEPGPQDDLRIETSDVELDEHTISTNSAVGFRWGPHFGSGKRMTIKLLADSPSKKADTAGPNVSGIESFELTHVDRLHLDLGQTGAAEQGKPTSVPVEITCSGPLRFHSLERLATFRDQVDVRRLNPAGPADQLVCDVLKVCFRDRQPKQAPSEKTPATKDRGSLDLEAERIQAVGKPVVVTAPSERLLARGEQFDYDLLKKSIAISGGNEVSVQRGLQEIRARSLSYQSAEEGRLGLAVAQGPGSLCGQADDRPEQRLEADWKDQLRIDPDKDNPNNKIISLTGGAELRYRGIGQLQAKSIFFWLTETPPKEQGKPWGLQPDKMLASDNVGMNWTGISGTVDQMEVWFRQQAASLGAAPAASRQTTGIAQPNAPAAPTSPGVTAAPSPNQRHFEVSGRLLQALVLLDEKQQAVLSDLTILDRVSLRETQTAASGERPLEIRGDSLRATNASLPDAVVTVLGSPARFEARGLGLSGSNINLERDKNHVSIDGPGQMTLPMKTKADPASPQPPAAIPGTLTVNWQRSMDFRGKMAHFKQGVIATAPQQQLQTAEMEVHLRQSVDFSQETQQTSPEVEAVRCFGGVTIDNRSEKSRDRLSVAGDLGMNLLSGAVTAGGPGWINSVFLNVSGLPGSPPTPQSPQSPLKCLHIEFQKSAEGNLSIDGSQPRKLKFSDQVKMAYAPVDNWDAMLLTNDPQKLGPQGMTGECDELTVSETPIMVAGRRALGVQAIGNAIVEGIEYTASGAKISYEEAKELLTLEGDGRSEAQLYRQLEVGGQRSAVSAKVLRYCPGRRLLMEGVQSLEMGEIGQPASGNMKR